MGTFGRKLRNKVLLMALGGDLYRRLTGDDNTSRQMALFNMRYELTMGLPRLTKNTGGGGQFIVTLTSYGKRIATTAPKAIWSIFTGAVLPDRVILWLAHDDKDKITPSLEKLQAHGLEIRFGDDLKSYKKLIPALREFPDDILITADDDTYYPRDWLSRLKAGYAQNPTKIWCHRAHIITLDEQRQIRSYNRWQGCAALPNTPSGLVFPTGVGGVLYPPHSLHPLITAEKEFLTLAPTADDVWSWAMAKLQGTEYGVIENGYGFGGKMFDLQNESGEKPLWQINTGEQNANDRQIAAVLAKFPEVKAAVVNSGGIRANRAVYNFIIRVASCFIINRQKRKAFRLKFRDCPR
ncbi:MAG: hypothetical protein LBP75_07820 [Planctomycetota bacterium]|jgi:hypothetical protein|nr:hypothetical protein [Planctomycetota bacterium]